MYVLTVTNQKGGVAKTTTAISLAAALAELGRRVLAIDADPQGNLTMGLGADPDEVGPSTLDVLVGTTRIGDALRETSLEGLSLLPSSIALAGAEKRLYGEIGFDEILRARLAAIDGAFDYAVIDCPPSLGLLTVNAIGAARTVIVPVQCEYFSAKGLGQLIEIVAAVRDRLNPALRLRVLPTLFDRRNRVCRQVLGELRKAFAEELYPIEIGIDTRLRECCVKGRPITDYAPATRAAKEYRTLARVVIADEESAAQRERERERERARAATHAASLSPRGEGWSEGARQLPSASASAETIAR